MLRSSTALVGLRLSDRICPRHPNSPPLLTDWPLSSPGEPAIFLGDTPRAVPTPFCSQLSSTSVACFWWARWLPPATPRFLRDAASPGSWRAASPEGLRWPSSIAHSPPDEWG